MLTVIEPPLSLTESGFPSAGPQSPYCTHWPVASVIATLESRYYFAAYIADWFIHVPTTNRGHALLGWRLQRHSKNTSGHGAAIRRLSSGVSQRFFIADAASPTSLFFCFFLMGSPVFMRGGIA